ncbi:hypothetical protein C8Q80DRAFT_1185799 [Daedaleopsis nitida]|nr:hypothetical protein C8Q80DRAFT_1185799 [Daedaleopsis nitida]
MHCPEEDMASGHGESHETPIRQDSQECCTLLLVGIWVNQANELRAVGMHVRGRNKINIETRRSTTPGKRVILVQGPC